MRGRGFEPHTERMLNAGNDGLQLLNMGSQEPTLPVPDCNQISPEFYIPQHTCATKLAMERYCREYRMPSPPQGTGLLILFKGQGKGGILTNPSHRPQIAEI